MSNAAEIAAALDDASHYREAMKRQQRYLVGSGRGRAEAEGNIRYYEHRAGECFDRATVARAQDEAKTADEKKRLQRFRASRRPHSDGPAPKAERTQR